MDDNWRGMAWIYRGLFEPKTEKLMLRQGKAGLTLGLQTSKVVEAFLTSRLVKGTYAVADGRIIYSADAQLQIGEGILISADTGVMTSDMDQKTVSGNLAFQNIGEHTFTAIDAILRMNGGMTAKSIRLGPIIPKNENEPNQAARQAPLSPSSAR